MKKPEIYEIVDELIRVYPPNNFSKIEKISIKEKDRNQVMKILSTWYIDLGYPFTNDERKILYQTLKILESKEVNNNEKERK